MAVFPNAGHDVRNPYSYGFNQSRFQVGKNQTYGHQRNRFDAAGYYDGAATPVGYGPGQALVLAQKHAGLGTTCSDCMRQGQTLAGTLWATKPLAANLASENTLTANASLIVALAVSLLSANTVSGSVNMTLQLAASLASHGNITAALSAIAFCVAEMTSDGNLNASNLRGTARMEASISTEGQVTTARACAEAVWSALAASFNDPGTMGEKLNGAGSAGNPWTEVIESGYTAAQIMRLLAAVAAGNATGLNGSPAFKGLDGTTTRVAGTVAAGTRTVTTVDGS